MAIDPPPPCPDRDRLEELIIHTAKRVARAKHKVDIAAGELVDAKTADAAARERLRQWHIDNPDPQGKLI